MTTGRILRWLVFAAAVVGVIRVTRDEFALSLDDYLNTIVIFADSWVEPIAEILRPWIADLFNWLGWKISLQYHWIYVYGLLQLLLGSYAGSYHDGLRPFRRVLSILFAVTFGVLAGTVHLAHLSVFLYPAAGYFLFVATNRGLDAVTGSAADDGSIWSRFGSSGVGWVLAGAAAVAAAASLPLTTALFSGTSKSIGLVLSLSAVFLLTVVFLLFGFPGGQRARAEVRSSWTNDPGTQTGIRIMSILIVATILVSVSQFRERSTERVPTNPIPVANGFRDCDKIYCPTMMSVPAGSFDMGSDDAEVEFAVRLGAKSEQVQDEKPSHKVSVKQFALSVTEVTRDQFEAFVAESRYRPEGFCFGLDDQKKVQFGGERTWENPGFPQQGDHPAVCLTWWDAKAYAAYLSRKTGHKYRLPSEAEWEYAARAGSTTSRHWGENNEDACQHANVADAVAVKAFKLDPAKFFSCTDGYVFTAPVAKFKPNAFGLHDMMGNASEWTEDCYSTSYNGAPTNGSVWSAGNCDLRVIRGGSWAFRVSSALRTASGTPLFSGSTLLGFRVSRTN